MMMVVVCIATMEDVEEEVVVEDLVDAAAVGIPTEMECQGQIVVDTITMDTTA
jgi:hypothetical protein